jgi:hypothetical protein
MTQPEVLAPRAKINSSVLVIVAGGTWLMKGVVLNCEVQIVLFVERDKRWTGSAWLRHPYMRWLV